MREEMGRRTGEEVVAERRGHAREQVVERRCPGVERPC